MIFIKKIRFSGCLGAKVRHQKPLAVLSTLPDNMGDYRFWTISPGLQGQSMKSPG